jgi:hypothetical protein
VIGWMCGNCDEPNRSDWSLCHNCDAARTDVQLRLYRVTVEMYSSLDLNQLIDLVESREYVFGSQIMGSEVVEITGGNAPLRQSQMCVCRDDGNHPHCEVHPT